MPRYFFHLRNDAHTQDEEGKELPDLAAAREHALEAARDVVCGDIRRGYLNLDHYVEVTDESGDTVLKLTFREAFTIAPETRDRPPNPAS